MPEQVSEQIVFIAGPTASGKSAAALSVARALGGEIVNADAMQVYRDLRILTARPSPEDGAAAPHHLYGVLSGGERCSAGRWAQMAAKTLRDISGRGKVAIVVGGTGLYFRALEDGLSPIPETPPDIRERAAARHLELGAEGFRAEVIANDPPMQRLPAGDTQRLLRAWEVHALAGKPLSYFQSLPRTPLVETIAARIVIKPPRPTLYENCDTRAAEMMSEGAVEEVRALLSQNFDPSMPVMKSLGVAEIAALLTGRVSEAETLAALQQNTRRFAKRQLTWFRNQAPDWPRAENAADAERALGPLSRT
ncbi:tRNA (adenosine(37)-N6)-dimethylallyltransferase MiaA [Hyphococcus sp.]|uniref:tRNA (adenosine(37)-N6)-dimethylallyltransferase MiaA n=1 Tax=Hyphococcus sp. TaxID=2038636 RepID=UPI002088D4B9|nr:MAG: tRNA dimethylallyltransferase [Marinicaulis sp.]